MIYRENPRKIPVFEKKSAKCYRRVRHREVKPPLSLIPIPTILKGW
jgi:hypothetical protein